MRHFSIERNIGLVTARSNKSPTVDHFFISNCITEAKYGERTTQSAVFPLYVNESKLLNAEKVANFNHVIFNKIRKSIASDKEIEALDIFDYIYAILYSPTYREIYKAFLKSDFPRVPYPKDAETFWSLVKLGGELRQLHLLESPLLKKPITTYPKAGDNLITRKIVSKDWELYDTEKGLGRIWINDEQYIDAIPLIAWEFYIGGYQPAQKWLKDRVGRTLTLDDIRHYQKIVVALKETDRLMQEIDQVWKP